MGGGAVSDLHAALVAALSELTTVTKGNTAKIPTKDGGSYSYTYADLSDVVCLTRPALAAHGLVALTPIVEGPAVRVLIVHTSGEELDLGGFPFAAGRDAQSHGSAVTYARRYALLAALGIAPDDDDDGHRATQAVRQPAKPRESQALIEAREAAALLGDSARTVVPSIVAEVTGSDAKLADLGDDDLRAVTAEILRTVSDSEEVVGGE